MLQVSVNSHQLHVLLLEMISDLAQLASNLHLHNRPILLSLLPLSFMLLFLFSRVIQHRRDVSGETRVSSGEEE